MRLRLRSPSSGNIISQKIVVEVGVQQMEIPGSDFYGDTDIGRSSQLWAGHTSSHIPPLAEDIGLNGRLHIYGRDLSNSYQGLQ